MHLAQLLHFQTADAVTKKSEPDWQTSTGPATFYITLLSSSKRPPATTSLSFYPTSVRPVESTNSLLVEEEDVTMKVVFNAENYEGNFKHSCDHNYCARKEIVVVGCVALKSASAPWVSHQLALYRSRYFLSWVISTFLSFIVKQERGERGRGRTRRRGRMKRRGRMRRATLEI